MTEQFISSKQRLIDFVVNDESNLEQYHSFACRKMDLDPNSEIPEEGGSPLYWSYTNEWIVNLLASTLVDLTKID